MPSASSWLMLVPSSLRLPAPVNQGVSPITRSMRAATYFSARPCSKGFQAFLASSACAASATSYPSCSAASLPWPSGFSWAAHIFKAGRSLLAFGSNSAVKRTASPPLTLAVSTTENLLYSSPCLFKRHSTSQALFSAGFAVSLGFACWHCVVFQPFWLLALA